MSELVDFHTASSGNNHDGQGGQGEDQIQKRTIADDIGKDETWTRMAEFRIKCVGVEDVPLLLKKTPPPFSPQPKKKALTVYHKFRLSMYGFQIFLEWLHCS